MWLTPIAPVAIKLESLWDSYAKGIGFQVHAVVHLEQSLISAGNQKKSRPIKFANFEGLELNSA
jgi:hypothetical protein